MPWYTLPSLPAYWDKETIEEWYKDVMFYSGTRWDKEYLPMSWYLDQLGDA